MYSKECISYLSEHLYTMRLITITGSKDRVMKLSQPVYINHDVIHIAEWQL